MVSVHQVWHSKRFFLAEVAYQRQPSPTVFLDKIKRIYHPMSILVRREQEKYFLDWKVQ